MKDTLFYHHIIYELVAKKEKQNVLCHFSCDLFHKELQVQRTQHLCLFKWGRDWRLRCSFSSHSLKLGVLFLGNFFFEKI